MGFSFNLKLADLSAEVMQVIAGRRPCLPAGRRLTGKTKAEEEGFEPSNPRRVTLSRRVQLTAMRLFQFSNLNLGVDTPHRLYIFYPKSYFSSSQFKYFILYTLYSILQVWQAKIRLKKKSTSLTILASLSP